MAQRGRVKSRPRLPRPTLGRAASAVARTIAIIGAIEGAIGRGRDEPRDANKIRKRPRPDNVGPRYYSALAELLLCS